MPENAVSPARSNAPALMNCSSPLSTTPYELLVQAVMDYAIYMLDPSGGHVVSWNPGAERIKGYAAKEIIGEHFSRFRPRKTELPAFPGLL
jgi:PAS domain-containing protein